MNSTFLKNKLFEAPGIYLNKNIEGSELFGKYSASVTGLLGSKASRDNWTLFFDGLLIDESESGKEDSEKVLDIFLSEGIQAFHKVNGFFNILIINSTGEEIFFVSDLLCSRPWYLFKRDTEICLAPTPTFFAALNLNMSLNQLALYEQIRLLHTGSDRTLVNEVERILPGFHYKFIDETLTKERGRKFIQKINENLSLEECSKSMTELFEKNIKAVLEHPKLTKLPIHLPITGGLDSRHLLGEVLKQDRKPELLRHIRIQEKDYLPAKEIAKSLDIPLLTRSLTEVNTKDLLTRWIERGGGLTNIHQYYLLDLKNNNSKESGISFNGYLMDILIGMSVKTANLDNKENHKAVWNRTYSSNSIRKLCFKNDSTFSETLENKFKEEVSKFEGEPWFRMLMLDLHHRGLHYTGNIDTMLDDEVYSFSPAASLTAYEFASQAPHKIAGDKKAKLHSLRTYFPNLSSFAGVEGVSFSEMTIRPEIIEHPILKNLKLIWKSLKSGFTKEIASESEHSWVRKNKDLHKLHKFLVFNSELVKDGHIRSIGVKTSWFLNEIGGYQGWFLMSFISSEIAYRVMVKKENFYELLDHIFGNKENSNS